MQVPPTDHQVGGPTTGPDNPLDDDALITSWGLIIEACAAVNRHLGRDLEHVLRLPGPWFEILLRLARSPGGGLPLTQLARQVSFSSGGLTKVIDRMEAEGLVERRPDDRDRRVVNAVITSAGTDLLGRAASLNARGLRHYVLEPLGEEQLARLATTMRALRDEADRRGGHAPR